jgi:hypothetical protein
MCDAIAQQNKVASAVLYAANVDALHNCSSAATIPVGTKLCSSLSCATTWTLAADDTSLLGAVR